MLRNPLPPLLASFALLVALAAPSRAAETVDFGRDIRGVLSNRCFRCHGPDPSHRKGGLRLDTFAGASADLGDGRRAVVPGDPRASVLLERVTSADPEERMPPPSAGEALSPIEIEHLREWIRDGARYAGHWAYELPRRAVPPDVESASWPRTPVDRFVLARLEREGLRPSPEATRTALARRVALDLTGLPPTLEELDAFLADSRVDAYERHVDHLLAKPSYGEHWARKWLDLARYADSSGYADDPPRTIWAYRDWVIRALNRNQPFDEFTVEQLAGDLLEQPTDEQLIATAFHRNTLTNNEGGTSDEEFRNVAIIDRVNTTFAVWMGTTANCAQCHSHKYDPISQEEYFRVFAILNQSEDADRRDESPTIPVWDDATLARREALDAEITATRERLVTPTAELRAEEARWEESLRVEPRWKSRRPLSVLTESGRAAEIREDGSVLVAESGENDVYTLEFALDGTDDEPLTALRLETLPDASLPGGGAGHGGGNFVLTRVHAEIAPPDGAPLTGRFVRLDLPGEKRILSLAEVQIFSRGEEVQGTGRATQSSTDYEGAAARATDGNTDGDYSANSTTHTATEDNPWWELEFEAPRPIDRIVVWNRTDNRLQPRLAGLRVSLLDDSRAVVWSETIETAPETSHEIAASGVRAIPLASAVADHEQDGFPAASVLDAKTDAKTDAARGWAVAPRLAESHTLTLVPDGPLVWPEGARLRITLEQRSKHRSHTLGRFRVRTTTDPGALEFARLPAAVRGILQKPAAERAPEELARLTEHFLSIAAGLAPVREELARLEAELAGLKPATSVPVLRELPRERRRETRIQVRGNFLVTGAVVEPGVPAAFHALPEGVEPDRLALARWLVAPENPLTARVIANRYWEAIFGVGLVRTSEEFGSQGELPSHPELLDWLACEFSGRVADDDPDRVLERAWDLKGFLRLLVTSATYRQSSRVAPGEFERDPENRLLARGPRFRLSAEMIRDQALHAAGLLSDRMYGPPVKPPQPTLGVNAAFGGGIDWETSPGEDRYRRALYTTWRRSNPYPSMATFDAPNREVCIVRRDRTNTPLQALVTLNDPVYIEAAQGLGRRMAATPGGAPERITQGFRICLCRPPNDAELATLEELWQDLTARFEDESENAMKLATDPIGPLPEGASPAEMAAWTVVGNVLLNLDEMFLKR